jgi:hypothetical protein
MNKIMRAGATSAETIRAERRPRAGPRGSEGSGSNAITLRASGDDASLPGVGFESPVQREPMPSGEVLKQLEQLVLWHRRQHEREKTGKGIQ